MAKTAPIGSPQTFIWWVGFRYTDVDTYQYVSRSSVSYEDGYDAMVNIREQMLVEKRVYRDVTPVNLYTF